MSGSLSATVGLLLVAGYVFLPLDPLKFLCLCVGCWWGLAHTNAGRRWIAWAVLAGLTYAAGFLLTPVASTSFLHPAGSSPAAATIVWQAALLLVGIIWLWLVLRWTGPAGSEWSWPAGWWVVLWAALLVAVHIAPWNADVTYGGDEHYHMFSAVMDVTLVHILFSQTTAALLLSGWLLSGLALWLMAPATNTATTESAHPKPASPFRFSDPARWRSRMLIWLFVGLAVAALAAGLAYPDPSQQPAPLQERTVRYPAAQPWFSAFLGLPCWATWGERRPLSFILLRFVPLLALFILGLQLGSDWRWKDKSAALKAVAVLGLLSVPTLLYHGTLLYLELPLLPLLWLVLRDSRRWFLASPSGLARRPAWWGAVLLGFTKDTGIVAIGMLWLAREAWQVHRWRRRRDRHAGREPTLRDEGALSAAVLGPGVLYMLLRSQQGSRPYLLHFENLLDAAAWWKAVSSPLIQFGVIWLLALAGARRLWQAKRRSELALCGALVIGISAFHFLERPEWIGLARFNLVVLPAVLYLGWEGLTWLVQRSRGLAGLACLALLGANWLTSPLDLQGRRASWGNSGERWYAYSRCLEDIRHENPAATVMLGNMRFPYGIGLVTERVGWEPLQLMNLPPVPAPTPLASLQGALERASERSIHYVIYRYEEPVPVPDGTMVGGYLKVRDYPSRVGGLLLLRRRDAAAAGHRPAA